MKKTIFTGFCIILFITSCTYDNKDVLNEQIYYEGSEGLTAEFLDNGPPETVFEGSAFPVSVFIHNEGAFDVIEPASGVISLTYDPFYFELFSQDTCVADVQRYGKGRTFVEGEIDICEVGNLLAKNISGTQQYPESQIYIGLCYPYKTVFVGIVCVDVDIYNQDLRRQVCEAEDISFRDQGAPVAVTEVKAELIPRGNFVQPRFVLAIENVGGGSVLSPVAEEEFWNACALQDVSRDTWNNIYGLEVKPILSPHPVETTIFIFRTLFEDGYKTYGHFADIIDISVLKSMIVNNKDDIGISREFFNKIVEDYKQKLDLKKIDIGGGMIHGNSSDFIDDPSSKIVLAHNSTKLTKEEKRVGSGSLFGLSDVLIPTNHNYDFTTLYNHISSNFPNLDYYQRKMFLNFKIVKFNPETMIIKEGEDIQNAYLLLNGQVEGIPSKDESSVIFTPGVILGEKTTFTGYLPTYTYVAKNYVKALEIPVKFFYHFIEKNNLTPDMLNKISKRMFLLQTKLFKDEISYCVLDKIVTNLEEHTIKKGEIKIASDKVYIILSGKVKVKINEVEIEVLEAFDDFGGITTILNYPSPCKYEAVTDLVLHSIPGDLLKEIPIVRWKMFESIEKLTEKFDHLELR